MKAKLIIYNLSKLDQYHKVLLNRVLFGYTDNSNNGKYQYKRKGILDKIPHFRLPKGAIIVKDCDENKVTFILKKHKAKYNLFSISAKQSMFH